MEGSEMQRKYLVSNKSTLVALVSLFWLMVGVGCGVVLDRQVLPGTVASGSHSKAVALDFRLMGEAWNLIDSYYVDRSAIKPRHMTYAAIAGMVNSLGDTGHSTFLTPEMVKEGRDDLEGHFAGIGAEVRMQGKHVVIVAPMDGSPAERAGLRPGDVIFKVDGKDTIGQSLEQVVRRIRGPAGSQVILAVRAPDSDKISSVTVTRAVIHVHSVSWHFLPGTKVADVRIASFSKGTARGLSRALAAAQAGGARALILDLRSDPGGLLDQAVDVASQFLHGGDVLLEKNVKGDVHGLAVNDDVPKVNLPMVVLTNPGTASASEIVAGALKDAGRATIVGQKTFGTGTVLKEFPLSDGSALMLAVEEWLTPKGHTIWHKGIKPDHEVTLADKVQPVYPRRLRNMTPAQLQASKDAQLLKALELLRRGHSVRLSPASGQYRDAAASGRTVQLSRSSGVTRIPRCFIRAT
jgi:carboxyl-terminal processing protease